MSESLVSVRNLRKKFGVNTVVNDVSFDVPKGSVSVIIGPSGSGKTTILRSLNALETPDSGVLTIGDFSIDFGAKPGLRDIALLRRQSATVFQGNNLFLNKTALENVTEGPIHAQKVPLAVAKAEAVRLLTTVGLGEKLDANPHQLSGGQQQRVGIARALALKPRVLLFDEPTSALDPELVGEVLGTMRDLAAQGWTMIVVTHEMRFAKQVADDVIFIDHGEIVEQGPPDQVLRNSQHKRTQEFLRALAAD